MAQRVLASVHQCSRTLRRASSEMCVPDRILYISIISIPATEIKPFLGGAKSQSPTRNSDGLEVPSRHPVKDVAETYEIKHPKKNEDS